MKGDRRDFLIGGTAALLGGALPAGARTATGAPQSRAPQPTTPGFPDGFLWGAATAGHQVEGNNTASDLWLLENLQPTAFAEKSGDACNSFELWPQDLDLARDLGLNTYRFSIEWARIEPEPGLYSEAMLDHYRRMIDGCRERGLTPVVTFNHFTAPRWFSADGGWLNPASTARFARYCERAAHRLAAGMGYATTLNEPNLLHLLKWMDLPAPLLAAQRAMLAAAARATGTPVFSAGNVTNVEDLGRQQAGLLAAHAAGRAAIKSVRPELPVGLSLAIQDDQAVGTTSLRDRKRAECYGVWLEAVKGDDFIGVQNYERAVYDAHGRVAPPAGVPLNSMGSEIYPPSLAGAVRYVHAATGRPVLVTEHGLATSDDAQRAAFIPAALVGLKAAIDAGVPVRGYIHWTLLDNFEWIFGYRPRLGLYAVDRQSFRRTAKPSAAVYGAIARANALQTSLLPR
ncbi:MAG: glycoside hydrolase family 1 protein [Gammaproteobacteria bacterium]|nr:glycoside hydrolase family 1 protein [Gammaproteobacteria bacterium]